VVGGQMSGVEIAGTIASHLSSAAHSPSHSPIADIAGYSIHHLIQHPVWVFPLHLTPKVCALFVILVSHILTLCNSRPRQHPLLYPWTCPPTISTTGHHP
jgi:hypothetical protein